MGGLGWRVFVLKRRGKAREAGSLWSQGLLGGCDTPPGSHTASPPSTGKAALVPRDSLNPPFLEEAQQSSPNMALRRLQSEPPPPPPHECTRVHTPEENSGQNDKGLGPRAQIPEPRFLHLQSGQIQPAKRSLFRVTCGHCPP